MASGRGNASEVAVLALPLGNGTEFAVIGADGLIFEGSLPFQAHNFALGRHSDGSVIVGLGDLRWNSGSLRPVSADEPLRIYRDGQIVYETQKAWDFNIASNGTSFVVHEPTSGGGASRLMIRNIYGGTEEQIDFDVPITQTNEYESGISLSYSQDETEIAVVLSHADSGGLGDYWFYSIKDGSSRRVSINSGLSAILTSSANGYFAEKPSVLDPDQHGDVWQISRREIHEDESKHTDIWTEKVSLTSFSGLMRLSKNGRWLALDGWTFKVLDTETGETVFSFPKSGDKASRLARLASILGPNAAEEDLSRIGSFQFIGDKLSFHSRHGSISACHGKSGGEWDRIAYLECVENLRAIGLYKNVADVFNMDNIKIDSQPDYRIETNRSGGCARRISRFGGLDEVDGRLVYLPESHSE